MKLDVPYFSQVGFGADEHNNDCGPACCSMALAYVKDIIVTPDEWYKLDWGAPTTDVGTYVWELRKALALFDVDSFYCEPLVELGEYPIITLVDYKVLSDAGITWKKGNFLHWVVVVGYNNRSIIVHDPYFPDEQGAFIEMEEYVFTNAYRWSALAVEKPKEDKRFYRTPGNTTVKPL